jgi:hypothetical protein
MENYIECAEISIQEKIVNLESRMDVLQEELIRTSSVYEMNNKKRQKE